MAQLAGEEPDGREVRGAWPDGGRVWIAAFLSFIVLLTAAGNSLLILLIFTQRSLRNTSNYFLVSLFMSDLMVGLVVMPPAMLNELYGRWVLDAVFCCVWHSFDVMCCSASILNLCVISLDRYLLIISPLKYKLRMTSCRAVGLILATWTLAALASFLPIEMGWHEQNLEAPSSNSTGEKQCRLTVSLPYALIASCLTFFLPSAAISFTYSRILLAARKQAVQVASLTTSMPTTSGDHTQANTATTTANTAATTANTAITTTATTNTAEANTATTTANTAATTANAVFPSRATTNTAEANTATTTANTAAPTANTAITTTATITTAAANTAATTANTATNTAITTTATANTAATTNATATTTTTNSVAATTTTNTAATTTNRTTTNTAATTTSANTAATTTSANTAATTTTTNTTTTPKTATTTTNTAATTTSTTTTTAGTTNTATTANTATNIVVTTTTNTATTATENTVWPWHSVSVNFYLDERHVTGAAMWSRSVTPDISREEPRLHGVRPAPPRLRCVRLSVRRNVYEIKTATHNVLTLPATESRKFVTKHSKKALKASLTLGILLGMFFVAWLPFFVANVVQAVCDCVPPGLFDVLTWLGYCNSTMNPIIYPLFMRDFKRAMGKYLPCCRRSRVISLSVRNSNSAPRLGL
ncbi:PREDICTED: 5-hydroxytryptamine receptor 6 [Nanorana parkeri]|uniref:5-hydroxytryptamine receptor 6 n=1 Tax=Nanorana parkeri TaxID=125878 RepID=UPI000854A876|nr:PREDICTED: 5-hydroxytryptamine receptor 6 [Nanorana parkeri]